MWCCTNVVEPVTIFVEVEQLEQSDVSQLPVLTDDKVVGIVDESDILLVVYSHHGQFNDPVRWKL